MSEIVAVLVMGLVFVGVALAGYYAWVLTSFFKELRYREPEVWQSIGSPTLPNMLLLPFIHFKKFYAFLPALKARRHSNYRYANKAWMMLKLGLLYCLLLAAMVALLAISVL